MILQSAVPGFRFWFGCYCSVVQLFVAQAVTPHSRPNFISLFYVIDCTGYTWNTTIKTTKVVNGNCTIDKCSIPHNPSRYTHLVKRRLLSNYGTLRNKPGVCNFLPYTECNPKKFQSEKKKKKLLFGSEIHQPPV